MEKVMDRSQALSILREYRIESDKQYQIVAVWEIADGMYVARDTEPHFSIFFDSARYIAADDAPLGEYLSDDLIRLKDLCVFWQVSKSVGRALHYVFRAAKVNLLTIDRKPIVWHSSPIDLNL
jgi:hypothetical protein